MEPEVLLPYSLLSEALCQNLDSAGPVGYVTANTWDILMFYE